MPSDSACSEQWRHADPKSAMGCGRLWKVEGVKYRGPQAAVLPFHTYVGPKILSGHELSVMVLLICKSRACNAAV